MTLSDNEQHATLAGLSYSKPIILVEHTGPDHQQGSECKLSHWLIKLADGIDLGATLDVATEASRLYRADKKSVVLSIAQGACTHIRPA